MSFSGLEVAGLPLLESISPLLSPWSVSLVILILRRPRHIYWCVEIGGKLQRVCNTFLALPDASVLIKSNHSQNADYHDDPLGW